MIISKIINRIVIPPKLIYHRIIRRSGIALSFYQIGLIITICIIAQDWLIRIPFLITIVVLINPATKNSRRRPITQYIPARSDIIIRHKCLYLRTGLFPFHSFHQNTSCNMLTAMDSVIKFRISCSISCSSPSKWFSASATASGSVWGC